jgi:hypothetical protein
MNVPSDYLLLKLLQLCRADVQLIHSVNSIFVPEINELDDQWGTENGK